MFKVSNQKKTSRRDLQRGIEVLVAKWKQKPIELHLFNLLSSSDERMHFQSLQVRECMAVDLNSKLL